MQNSHSEQLLKFATLFQSIEFFMTKLTFEAEALSKLPSLLELVLIIGIRFFATAELEGFRKDGFWLVLVAILKFKLTVTNIADMKI